MYRYTHSSTHTPNIANNNPQWIFNSSANNISVFSLKTNKTVYIFISIVGNLLTHICSTIPTKWCIVTLTEIHFRAICLSKQRCQWGFMETTALIVKAKGPFFSFCFSRLSGVAVTLVWRWASFMTVVSGLEIRFSGLKIGLEFPKKIQIDSDCSRISWQPVGYLCSFNF